MKRHSLYTITFLIFLSLGVIILSIVYFSINLHRRDLIKSAIGEKVHLAETINETILSPLWIYRVGTVPEIEKTLIREMVGFKDIAYIRIVGEDGIIYKSNIEREWGGTIEDPNISKVIKTKEMVIKDQTFNGRRIKLIIYPARQNKTIWVGFYLEGIEKKVHDIFIRDLSMIVIILILIFISFVLFLKIVINPLKKLTATCEKIKKGDLNARADVKSKTEIGDLASVFNDMISELQRMYKRLKNSQKILEQKVKERTEELEEARESLEIKVRARTKELEELNQNLESRVEERTKALKESKAELQKRVEELERFRKIAVGRELTMVELKKQIERLKEKLQKQKSKS